MNLTMRPRRLAPILLAAVVLLGACNGTSGSTQNQSGSPTSSGPAAASPTPTPTASAAPAPAVVAVGTTHMAQVRFRSPTGNVACWMQEGVICRAAQHTWSSQAEDPPTGCDQVFAGVQLTSDEVRERSDCYDPAEGAQAVLAYGHGLELDGVRCVSEERGVTCVRTTDAAGFSLSRDTLTRTPWDSPLLHVPATQLGGAGTTVFPAGVEVQFRTAGGLADCVVRGDAPDCTVDTQATPTATEEPDCDLDQVPTATIPGTGAGELVLVCRGDANGSQDELPAGQSLQVGDLKCTATASGLRCAHLGGGQHGFEVTTSTFRGF